MPDETIGELSRRLDRFETRHDRERASADARHLDAEVYFAERNHFQIQLTDLATDHLKSIDRLEGEIKEIKARLTWAWRIALTGGILPVLVVIIAWLVTQGEPGQ